jgi:hypothetical protein
MRPPPSPMTPYSTPLYTVQYTCTSTCNQYIVLIHTGKGGGGRANQRDRGAIVHNASRNYQHDLLYLNSINTGRKYQHDLQYLNSIKHQ